MKDEAGVYIHIPFCARKCSYCDFVSFENKNQLIDEYIKKLEKEICTKLDKLNNYEISTIYIGGGTPSYINSEYIVDILNLLPVKNAKEVTIEVNPGTITEQKILDYKNAGINRISIGLQTTNNELLKKIGRIHTYEKFLESYKIIKKYFNNINIDLMIGLPSQTIEDVIETLREIISLDPEHISVYSLIVEENTKLDLQIKNNEIFLPDDDLERKMYWTVKNVLEEAGFLQYEISNFSKETYESKHNINCWKQKEYFGFGVAAHSYINNVRYCNTSSLKEYLENPLNEIVQEKQNNNDKQREYMILGLRTLSGINIEEFTKKFTKNPLILYEKELEKLLKTGFVKIEKNSIRLTLKGIDFANMVWKEFI